MESKPWYLSKTVWGLVVTVLGILLPKLPIQANAGMLTDSAVAVAGNIASAIGVGLAAYGRIMAKGPLTS